MKKYFLINIIILTCELINISQSEQMFIVEDISNIPCSYYDTVDLTNTPKFPNGSYLYEGIIIPKNLVGVYNYHLESLTSKVITEPHTRGCICLLKACVKWCCDGKEQYLDDNQNCSSINVTTSSELTITTNLLDSKTIDVLKFFFPQTNYLPCEQIYDLSPESFETDKWILYENGTLFRYDDSQLFLKQNYCLSLSQSQELDSMEYSIKPYICNLSVGHETRNVFYAYAMMFSVPFMIITIIIYSIIPELRNLNGKSLICYLSGLVVAYSVFCYLLLTSGKLLSTFQCALLGFIAYFSFMSSFFWLSVISFDLYWTFHNSGRNRSKGIKRFLWFGFYSWGLAFVFLGITVFAQYSELVPFKFKPGIGLEYCWLNVKTNFSATIYLFGPVLCIIIFNSIMFGLTAFKIYNVQREMSKFTTRGEESRRNINCDKNQFGLFLRLFLVMGVTWSTEILAYFVGEEHEHMFYVLDFLNMIQGFLIFTFFVLKKRVKELIFKKFSKSDENKLNRNSSGKTTKTTLTSNIMQNTDSPLVIREN